MSRLRPTPHLPPIQMHQKRVLWSLSTKTSLRSIHRNCLKKISASVCSVFSKITKISDCLETASNWQTPNCSCTLRIRNRSRWSFITTFSVSCQPTTSEISDSNWAWHQVGSPTAITPICIGVRTHQSAKSTISTKGREWHYISDCCPTIWFQQPYTFRSWRVIVSSESEKHRWRLTWCQLPRVCTICMKASIGNACWQSAKKYIFPVWGWKQVHKSELESSEHAQ